MCRRSASKASGGALVLQDPSTRPRRSLRPESLRFDAPVAQHLEALKIVMPHTGGALPYQSGKMDQNMKRAKLQQPASTYIKRTNTYTVSPHTAGIKFAIE